MEKSTEINELIYIGTALTATFGCLIVILALFYQNRMAKAKRMEAELMLKTSLESEKKERYRLASDIHDGISGDLNAIRNYLALLAKEEKSPRQENVYVEIRKSVESAIENTKQVSYNLMPPLLDSHGLPVALQNYFSKLSKLTSIHFIVVEGDTFAALDSNTAYEVYKIIQELTTNMIKYGKISSCLVSFEKSGTITISDDGIPFSLEAMAKSDHAGAGIKNIMSRTRALGARILQERISDRNSISIQLKHEI